VRAVEFGLHEVLPPGVAARPVEVQEDFVRQGGHRVLRAFVKLEPEVAAVADGLLLLAFEDVEDAAPCGTG
jgi:hypothetical protein